MNGSNAMHTLPNLTQYIKIIFPIILVIIFSGCAHLTREITTYDKNFTFKIPMSFRQTEKDHPVITSLVSGNYKIDIWARPKTIYEEGFKQFIRSNINREQLISLKEIRPLRTTVTNEKGYNIVSFYGEGEDPSWLWSLYSQGYAYAIETPDFFIRVRLVHSSWQRNAMHRVKAEEYMRVLLESFRQN